MSKKKDQKKIISVTLRNLFESVEALNDLVEVPMPARLAFSIRKLSEQVNNELELARKTLADSRLKYVEEEDDDIPKDKLSDWDAEVGDLLDTSIKLNGETIQISSLGTAQLKPRTLLALSWLVVD